MASSTTGLGSSSPYLYSSMINTIQQSFAHPHESDKFETFTLTKPINYSNGDCIESWMNNLLQMKPPMTSLLSCGFPIPEQCKLFYVNRDILFSGSAQAEAFLQSLMSVLSSSERVVNPDLLLKFADSPNYDLFCLLPPLNNSAKRFTDIITAIVVHVENEIPENIVHCGTNLNESIAHCFNEWKTGTLISQPKFLPTQGIHIESIVTRQSYRKMGYGMRAFQLLQDFYEGKCISLDENHDFKSKVAEKFSEESMDVDSELEAALLQQLTEVQPEDVDYILVTCSLTSQSLRFWKKANFVPAFITDEINFEGGHVLFMVKGIKNFDEKLNKSWLCFQKHLCVLLGSVFKHFPASLALDLIHFSIDSSVKNTTELTKECIDILIRPHRMKSLMKYCQNLQNFHSALQFIPILSNLYFKNYFKDMSLSRVQEAILLSFGLQFKVSDDVSKDLGLPNIQIHGLLNRTIKKLVKYLNDIIERSVEKSLENPEVVMEPITQDLNEELEEAAKKIQEQQEKDAKRLLDLDISQYAIKGSEDDWQKALFSGRKALVNIKSIKKTNDSVEKDTSSKQNFKKNKRPKKQRR